MLSHVRHLIIVLEVITTFTSRDQRCAQDSGWFTVWRPLSIDAIQQVFKRA